MAYQGGGSHLVTADVDNRNSMYFEPEQQNYSTVPVQSNWGQPNADQGWLQQQQTGTLGWLPTPQPQLLQSTSVPQGNPSSTYKPNIDQSQQRKSTLVNKSSSLVGSKSAARQRASTSVFQRRSNQESSSKSVFRQLGSQHYGELETHDENRVKSTIKNMRSKRSSSSINSSNREEGKQNNIKRKLSRKKSSRKSIKESHGGTNKDGESEPMSDESDEGISESGSKGEDNDDAEEGESSENDEDQAKGKRISVKLFKGKSTMQNSTKLQTSKSVNKTAEEETGLLSSFPMSGLPESLKLRGKMKLPPTVTIGTSIDGKQLLIPVVHHEASFQPEIEIKKTDDELAEELRLQETKLRNHRRGIWFASFLPKGLRVRFEPKQSPVIRPSNFKKVRKVKENYTAENDSGLFNFQKSSTQLVEYFAYKDPDTNTFNENWSPPDLIGVIGQQLVRQGIQEWNQIILQHNSYTKRRMRLVTFCVLVGYCTAVTILYFILLASVGSVNSTMWIILVTLASVFGLVPVIVLNRLNLSLKKTLHTKLSTKLSKFSWAMRQLATQITSGNDGGTRAPQVEESMASKIGIWLTVRKLHRGLNYDPSNFDFEPTPGKLVLIINSTAPGKWLYANTLATNHEYDFDCLAAVVPKQGTVSRGSADGTNREIPYEDQLPSSGKHMKKKISRNFSRLFSKKHSRSSVSEVPTDVNNPVARQKSWKTIRVISKLYKSTNGRHGSCNESNCEDVEKNNSQFFGEEDDAIAEDVKPPLYKVLQETESIRAKWCERCVHMSEYAANYGLHDISQRLCQAVERDAQRKEKPNHDGDGMSTSTGDESSMRENMNDTNNKLPQLGVAADSESENGSNPGPPPKREDVLDIELMDAVEDCDTEDEIPKCLNCGGDLNSI